MKVRAKMSMVIQMPDGSVLPLPRGREADVPIEVYNSCWELMELIEQEPPPAPVVEKVDVATIVECAMTTPPSKAVVRRPVVRKAKK